MNKLIGEFKKNWVFFSATDGQYYPTKKGLTLSVDGVIELISLLQDAVAEMNSASRHSVSQSIGGQ